MQPHLSVKCAVFASEPLGGFIFGHSPQQTAALVPSSTATATSGTLFFVLFFRLSAPLLLRRKVQFTVLGTTFQRTEGCPPPCFKTTYVHVWIDLYADMYVHSSISGRRHVHPELFDIRMHTTLSDTFGPVN